MIAHLSGQIQYKQNKAVIVDVNGVGYLVRLTQSFLEKISEGEEIKLHIHTHVREDDISLYGFSTADEWMFFELLLTVSGVGPKSALEILNAPIAKVKQAIAKKDAAYLTRIPGIGKKTAERIIVDLQVKIKEQEIEEEAGRREESEDIIQALVAFGYSRQQVTQGLKKIPPEVSGEESIIKYFLQNI